MCVAFTVFRCVMVLSSLYMIVFLLVLMVGSVVLARYAQERQEGNVIRLYRLAALDRRRNETRAVIRGLQEVDDNAETLRILNQALKADLVRIQKLDPGRADLDQEIRQASAAPAAGAGDAKGDKPANEARGTKAEKRTSLSNERDVQRVRNHISDAMVIIRRLYQSNQVRAEQLESTARHLGTLTVVVAVNSSIHMAELALNAAEYGKVPGLLRMAEGYLASGPLQGREKAEKLDQVKKLRESLQVARNGSMQFATE